MKKVVLFLCTHNSSRSQMAEGIMNHYLGERYRAFSAGTQPKGVNKLAVEAMIDIGIDISNHYLKDVDEFRDKKFSCVVTVCGDAREACPVFEGTNVIHKRFADPALSVGSDEDKLACFKNIRNQIKDWILSSFS